MEQKLVDYLHKYKFKAVCPENCGSPWYERKFQSGAYNIKISVETFKEKPIYAVQIKTLEDDEIGGSDRISYNGAMLEKGDFIGLTLFRLKKKYGIEY